MGRGIGVVGADASFYVAQSGGGGFRAGAHQREGADAFVVEAEILGKGTCAIGFLENLEKVLFSIFSNRLNISS